MKTTAVFDLDSVKHACACAGEKRSIKVIHKQSGDEMEFNTRTEFWGRGKKGGYLEELNKGRDSPYLPDEYDILDIQTPEPLKNVLHSAKIMTEGIVRDSGASSAKYFIGEGESWRVGRSTLLEYKGNRRDLIKPLHMGEVVDYLKKKFNPEVVSEVECDDKIVMEAFKKDDHFCIAVDKDAYSQPTLVYNYNRKEEGVVDCRGLGRLWLDAKGKVRGTGIMHLLQQTCTSDTADNYKANCFSDVRWGEKSGYKALHEATTYKEAFSKAWEVFKTLYPEPKEVIGWRGGTITIDAAYVANEVFDLARMLRWEGDKVLFTDILDKLGIDH